jgi:hypothetical protein
MHLGAVGVELPILIATDLLLVRLLPAGDLSLPGASGVWEVLLEAQPLHQHDKLVFLLLFHLPPVPLAIGIRKIDHYCHHVF